MTDYEKHKNKCWLFFKILKDISKLSIYRVNLLLNYAFLTMTLSDFRIATANEPVSPLGGYSDFNQFTPSVDIEGALIADSVGEIRKVVRREIKYRADWIKVEAIGFVMKSGDVYRNNYD